MAKVSDIPLRTVRLQNASLDEREGIVVAHGWLDIEALNELLVGDYQREILEASRGGRKTRIEKALESDVRLPDISLGMRGDTYSARGQTMTLENDVYIIDGLQRVSGLRAYAVKYPDKAKDLRIGCEVRFNTTRETEKELFTALNLNRTAMSPNVILRNARDENKAVLTLYGLSNSDVTFPLYGKVSWNQRMTRGEVTSALTLAKSCLVLHHGTMTGHSRGGGTGETNVRGIGGRLDKAAAFVGLSMFRTNVHHFISAVDEVWGIKGIKYSDLATHLRSNFMFALAKMVSDHENFWDGKKLIIDGATKQKLKNFPLDDPSIIKLSSSGSGAAQLLYRHLVDHFDKGKRINRLVRRKGDSE